MPQAIAYAAAAIADFAAAQLGDAVFAAVYYTSEVVITVALAAAVGAATAPSLPKAQAVQVPLKQSFVSRRSAFGEVRVSGPYALFEAVGSISYDVLALLDGRSDSFTRYYFNDDRLTLVAGTDGVHGPDGKKYEYGTSGDRCFFHTRLGLDTETAYADVVAAVPAWTSTHRGDGITSIAVICKQSKEKFQQEDFPNGLPSPGAAVKAQLVFDPRVEGQIQGDKSTYAWSDNNALCLLAFLTDANGGMGFDYGRRILPVIDQWIAAADDCDLTEAVSGQNAVVDVAAAAGASTITLSNVTGLAAGVVIFFPAEAAEVASVAGSVVTFVAPLAYAQAEGIVATWSASGTEPRYRCAGVYAHDNPPSDVIGAILASFDGWMAPRGDGALVVKSGRYYEPTVTFADRHVLSYSLTHFLTDEQAVNEYIPSFTDPNSEFTTVDAGAVQDDDDITARGVIRSSPLDLAWVPSASQAVRLAKRKLTRSTQELRGTVTTNLYGMNGLAERYIRLQISDNAALNDLVVEITDKVQIDLAHLTVTFPWVAADPTIDDGDPGAGVTIPGVPVARPTPSPLVAPSITSLTAVYDDAGTGVAGTRLQIDVSAPVSDDVQWLARWRVSGSTDWHESPYTDVADGSAVTLITGFVPASGTIEVEVAYVTAAQTSPWSAIASGAVSAPVTAQPYGFAFDRDIATFPADLVVRRFTTKVAWSIPIALAGSAVACSGAAPSAQTDFDLQVAGSSVGTIRFASGSTTATFIKAAATAVAAGGVTSIVAPSNLNGMTGTLYGEIGGTR